MVNPEENAEEEKEKEQKNVDNFIFKKFKYILWNIFKMSEFLQTKIKEWVSCDNQLNELKTQSKEIRQSKNSLTNDIFNYVHENNLDNSVIEISDSTLRFQKTNQTSPLTFRFLESCLNDCISNEQQVKNIINYIKKKREVKVNYEIKRRFNKII
tara:strand:+ start:259 stop:723 length:465 start_codon:yes stop_codon:yes gene_type:complete